MALNMTDLEQAAMLIVLEAPRRRTNATSYVRSELITWLERALRKQGFDEYLDKALRHMRDHRRKEKAESDAFIAKRKAQMEKIQTEKVP